MTPAAQRLRPVGGGPLSSRRDVELQAYPQPLSWGGLLDEDDFHPAPYSHLPSPSFRRPCRRRLVSRHLGWHARSGLVGGPRCCRAATALLSCRPGLTRRANLGSWRHGVRVHVQRVGSGTKAETFKEVVQVARKMWAVTSGRHRSKPRGGYTCTPRCGLGGSPGVWKTRDPLVWESR